MKISVIGGGSTYTPELVNGLLQRTASFPLREWTVQALAHMWTRRGPATQLADVMIQRAGARDLEDLLEGIVNSKKTRSYRSPLLIPSSPRWIQCV